MELAILGDTHIPSRATELPTWVRERVGAADHTIHTGDFDSTAAFDAVRELTDGAFTAVQGNMDGRATDLPEVVVEEFDGVEFVVTHGTGDLDGYHGRVVEAVREHGGDDAIGVAGHTHQPEDTVVDGVRLLNPGSATGADPAEATTMMTATVEAGDLDVHLHTE